MPTSTSAGLVADIDEYMRRWQQDGLVIIRNAVCREQVERTVAAIFDYLEMDPGNPQDWYDAERRQRSGIDKMGRIPFYHHQTLWDNRQNELIHAVYQRIYGGCDLLVSVDRVNMNPPVHEGWAYEGFIHWDIDVSVRPISNVPQGLLCLTDDDGSAGGFQCVPGFHNIIEDWLRAQGPGYNTRFPDTTGMDVQTIPLKAGDFVIFHPALPHGNRPNHSSRPRLAQYFTLFPKASVGERDLMERLHAYEQGRPTVSLAGKPFPVTESKAQDTRHIALTPLGQALLGRVAVDFITS